MIDRGWVESGAVVALSVVAVAVACGAGSTPDARYPQRENGCDVKIFPDTPPMPTDNLGPVEARCSEDTAQDECVRTLKDAVCKLGGDIAWGVNGTPSKEGGKLRYFGRAAHTKK